MEAAVGGHLTYLQAYTSTVKAMNDREPLQVRPHLLTYLLGESYVSGKEKFRQVWQEVDTRRTRLELTEIFRQTVPLKASLEVGLTGDGPFFLTRVSLSEMCGKTSFNIIVFLQVPVRQFPGYVCKLVGELYDAVEAVVKGRLMGSGALGTLVLCESLLSFLPTGNAQHQPYHLLEEYDVVPLGNLRNKRRIDLSPYASIKDGYLYISHRCVERIWVPLTSLPKSACATAKQMLEFLDFLRAAPASRSASVRAATIIVRQFLHDLLEMGIVRDMSEFQGAKEDAFVHGTCTARDYVKRVFVADNLPVTMHVSQVLPDHVG